MSAFLLEISLQTKNSNETRCFSLHYETSPKFYNDKINYEDDEYYLLLDGVVLNKEQLLNECVGMMWKDYLIQAYAKNGDQFFKQLRGSYYGFLYDKKIRKWIVFSDHIGSKPIYYAELADKIYFSNDYTKLTLHLKKNSHSITLNEQAAYLMLSYGYVFEDITIANEIKRMMIGYCAIVKNHLEFEKFYTQSNNPIDISEEDAIEKIDEYFRKAVQLAYEKDKEYGYKHAASLSGGLDSRMTVWVAHDMGYKDQLNLTFSQSDYLDETIAKKIASDLKHEWIFKALDNGNFLKDLDTTTEITGGNVLYYGIAHGVSLYKYLNFEKLGIMHSGQLGDVIISTFYSSLDPNKNFSFGDGAYSKEFLNRIKDFKFKEEYHNEELFKLYIRGFYGANQGLKGISEYTETYSPFYDIDFMEMALSIPLKLRFKHNLYKKWIIKKYPEAAKYIWEKENVPVDYKYWISLKGKQIPINQIFHKFKQKFGHSNSGISSKNHMNPITYWYQSNFFLQKFMNDYFKNNIELLNDWPKLKSDCETLFNNGSGTEKVQVLSLLSTLLNIILDRKVEN